MSSAHALANQLQPLARSHALQIGQMEFADGRMKNAFAEWPALSTLRHERKGEREYNT